MLSKRAILTSTFDVCHDGVRGRCLRDAAMLLRSLVFAMTAAIAATTIADAQTPATTGGHPYDPCAMVSKSDVASALGVATEQVFTPATPSKNECVWAVAGHTGVHAQQAALTIQTIDEVKHAHGFGIFAPLLRSVRQIPGVPISNENVNHMLDDAQEVANLGDRAGWKNGTLTVVKKELLLQVRVDGSRDSQSLQAAKTIAQTALQHVPTDQPR